MKEYEIVGDKVNITTPTRTESKDIRTVYDDDVRDVANIEREILEYQAKIVDAQLRLADRQERITLLEPLAAEKLVPLVDEPLVPAGR